MRCSFCATGKGGFARNLKAHEIVDQVMTVQEEFGRRVSNIGQHQQWLPTCMALQLASLPECSKLRTSEIGAKFAASMHAVHAASKLVKPSLGVLVSSRVLQHIPAHSCTPASTLLHILTHSGSSILTHPFKCPELPAALQELEATQLVMHAVKFIAYFCCTFQSMSGCESPCTVLSVVLTAQIRASKLAGSGTTPHLITNNSSHQNVSR